MIPVERFHAATAAMQAHANEIAGTVAGHRDATARFEELVRSVRRSHAANQPAGETLVELRELHRKLEEFERTLIDALRRCHATLQTAGDDV